MEWEMHLSSYDHHHKKVSRQTLCVGHVHHQSAVFSEMEGNESDGGWQDQKTTTEERTETAYAGSGCLCRTVWHGTRITFAGWVGGILLCRFERARKEEETLEASKPKAEAKNLTAIQQTTSTGMVFHLRTGKKQPNSQPRSASKTSVDKTRDIFGNDSDD